MNLSCLVRPSLVYSRCLDDTEYKLDIMFIDVPVQFLYQDLSAFNKFRKSTINMYFESNEELTVGQSVHSRIDTCSLVNTHKQQVH